MGEFFQAVVDHGFMRSALLAGLLAAVACGIIGSFVVVRRIVFISGGIAHSVLGGMGIACFLGGQPIHGALIAALVAAVIIGLVSLHARQKEDTIIGALWAVGMAVGVLFIARTPGYNVDLMSYLFGNILIVPPGDLALIAGLDVAIVALVVVFYRKFLAVCFDEEFARLQGVRVELIYILLLCLIALTVVTLIQVVGLILVIALLTLPAAIALNFSRSLVVVMALATGLGFIFTTGGLALSYGPDLPTGAMIVLVAGVAYLVTIGGRGLVGRLRQRS